MKETLKNILAEKLNRHIDQKNDFSVVMLPDFFLDHFVNINSYKTAIKEIKNIYMQGGGNIPKYYHSIQQGGNAANTALALGRLKINVDLICRTNHFGGFLLNYFLGQQGVNLDHVKKDGDLASTVALEFGEKHVNVMLNDPGSLADFSFESLDKKDLQKISNSDLVGIVNWNQNKYGTNLAERLFEFAKKNNVKTFFDSGDPTHRKQDIDELLKKVVFSENLDFFSLNENELKHYSGNYKLEKENDFLNALEDLGDKSSTQLELHTSNFSCTYKKNKYTLVPSFKIKKIYRTTGAGDAWNAGCIFSSLAGFEDYERLLFSNALAGCYVSSQNGEHPDIKEVIKFIKKTDLRK